MSKTSIEVTVSAVTVDGECGVGLSVRNKEDGTERNMIWISAKAAVDLAGEIVRESLVADRRNKE